MGTDVVLRQIQFTVPGEPISQPRAKATTQGGFTKVYTPTKNASGSSNGIAEWKAAVRTAAAAQMEGPLMTGPLRVDLVLVFQRPQAKVWKKKPMPRYRKVTKPDIDNCAKSIWDALKSVVWQDDNQICAGSIDKWHAAGDEAPHALVTITELEA